MAWLISKAMMDFVNSHCSPEPVAASLEANCLDGEPSAPSNGNPIPQAYCAPDKTTVFSRLSRFGMMFRPLMEDRGEELLTLYRAAFLAKTSQPQEMGPGSTESDQGCGEKWRGSFVKYDLNTSSWRTHQCSLLGGLDEFLETWPQWGLMRDGECWEVTPSESTQKEIEFGFWPTPTKSDGVQHGKEKWIANSRSKRSSLGKTAPTERITYVYFESNIPMKFYPELSEELMTWPKGWTRLEPLEMDKFREWQQQHGSN